MPPKRTKKPGLAALSNNSSKGSVSNLDKVSRTEVKPLRQTNSKLSATQSTGSRTITLLDLPNEVLEKIFRFLSYKQIAHLRQVCRKIDKVCQSILNSSFLTLQSRLNCKLEKLIAEMPRRESAKRNHPLEKEFDIIGTVQRHLIPVGLESAIKRKRCCFFPGEILDEANRVLHYVKVTPKRQLNWTEATTELTDLYCMAKQFFNEHIDANLPKISFFEVVEQLKKPESGTKLVEDLSRSHNIQESANENNKEASNNKTVDDEDDEKQSKTKETEEEIKNNGGDKESESTGFSPTDENSMKQMFAKLSANSEECNNNFAIVNKNISEITENLAVVNKNISEITENLAVVINNITGFNNNMRLLLLLLILCAVYFAISGKH